MDQKLRLLVIFGGQSSEHEVSCISVQNVISYVDTERYETLVLGITKEGKWLYVESAEAIADGSWRNGNVEAILSPDAKEKSLYLLDGEAVRKVRIDIVFPVLHGLNGEDGTIQGIFTLAGIPYVGCGVLASAVAMDKLFTKIIVDQLGIRQAAYVPLFRYELEDMEAALDKVEKGLPYPIFVKPSCAGSSVGVSRADNREELAKALTVAAREDSKILCEETIVGREVECAVIGSEKDVTASGVGEILAGAEFYDYDAKYHSADSQTILDPDFPEGVEDEIREDAKAIFRALNGFGLSRVDFFIDRKGVVFNEINTLPGFTGISMYPMLMEKAGFTRRELVNRLIELAFERKEH